MSQPPARFPWLFHLGVLIVIMLLGVAPAIVLAVVNALNSGAPVELGALMASWGVLGWLLLAPTAFGGLLFILWMVVLPVHYLLWNRKRMRLGEKL